MSAESLARLVAESKDGVARAQQLVDDLEAGTQRRRHEAWQCRIAGYAAGGLAALLFSVAMLLSHTFGIPGTEPVIFWLVGPALVSVILGSLLVLVGVAEAY